VPNFTIVWLVVYCACVVASFSNPVWGVVGYLFEYYLRPALHWWGKPLPDLRWNFTIAAVLTVAFLLRRSSLPQIGPARRSPGTFLVILLLLTLLVLPIAVNKTSSWEKSVELSKLTLFHGLVVGSVRTELAFDAVVATHIAGATYWGWEAFRDPKRSAGRLANVGSGDTRGDNGAAAHFLTVIPFIAVYLLMHADKRIKALMFVGGPLVLNAFILCNSRGAFLGLVAAAGAAVLLVKSGHRLRMIGAAAIMGIALYALADPQFIKRQQQTDYANDGSAQGRLEAWSGSLRLIADHPFGTGGQGFYELSPQYAAELVDRLGEKRDPHNTYVLVASEWGVLGLMVVLGYYGSVFKLLSEVKRRAEKGDLWYYRAVAIQVSLIGFLVAATFTDRLYAEAPFWMGAFAVALHRIQAYKLASVTEPAAAQPQAEPVFEPQPAI
jgi:putative inorganic carbon (HCO3(-)) transporter